MTNSISRNGQMSTSALELHDESRAVLQSRTFQQRALGYSFATILRLLSSTWRVEIEGLEILDEFTNPPRKHILAFWHRNYITLFRLFHHRSTIVVTNQSQRGQVIAEICRRTQMRSWQQPRKGTKQMVQSLEDATASGAGLAIALDGPLGPPCEVKRSVLHLASRLACPIVPISVATGWKHVFASRWDKLEIPHLFSRVSFVVGNPIHVASASSRAEIRELTLQLRNSIEAGSVVAMQRLRSP